jgi:hypothetical protein
VIAVTIIEAIALVLASMYIAQLVSQRHELDQELAMYRWKEMNELHEGSGTEGA